MDNFRNLMTTICIGFYQAANQNRIVSARESDKAEPIAKRMEQLLLTNAVAMSWCTLISALTVQWKERYTNCRLTCLCLSKWSSILVVTTFSMMLDPKCRFETGRWFLRLFISNLGFFKRAWRLPVWMLSEPWIIKFSRYFAVSTTTKTI